MLDVKNYELK